MKAPRLRSDTFFLEQGDGVLVRNWRGAFKVSGRSGYQWLEALAPLLDGTRSIEDIVAGLDVERENQVRSLITLLAERDCLRDAGSDAPHSLTEAQQELAAPQIAFLDAISDSPESRFERFASCRHLLVGDLALLPDLVRSLKGMGARTIDAVAVDELAGEGGQGDPARVLAEALSRCDVVGFVLSPGDAAIGLEINRHCLAHQRLCLPALADEDAGWFGPLMTGHAPPCWECAWRWLNTNQEVARPGRQWRLESAVSRSLIANYLAFQIFEAVTGACIPRSQEGLLRFDLHGLDDDVHQLACHHHCTACAPAPATTISAFLAGCAALQRQEALDDRRFSSLAARLFDPRTGVFLKISEEDLPQLPLRVSQVSFRDPSRPARTLKALSAGDEFSEARVLATLKACLRHAARTCDRSRLVPLDEAIGSPRAAFGDSDHEGTWAFELDTGAALLVPERLVFSNDESFAEDEEGLAIGFSWAEAVSRGLLDRLRRLALDSILTGHTPRPVSREALGSDPELARYLTLLDALRPGVTVHDISPHSCPAATSVVSLDGIAVACTSHFDPRLGIKDGLRSALLALQLQSTSADVPTEVLPAFSSSTAAADEIRILPAPAAADWEAALPLLVAALRQRGLRPCVVRLEHDRPVVDVIPFVVRVLALEKAER